MANTTAIEWTDISWNPVHGCSRVSTGCRNCYAETLSLRYKQTLKPWTARNAAENVILKPHKLREPLSHGKQWREPKRVFVNSMSDLFHEEIPDLFVAEIFGVMAIAAQHCFQVLTKRPERMKQLLSSERFVEQVGDACGSDLELEDWPLKNCWLGVSIENRKWVHRADLLRETPAAVRFISAEPLLGPLLPDSKFDWGATKTWWADGRRSVGLDAVPGLDLTDIDWVIAGGESGRGARRLDLQWMRDLRDACAAESVAYFVKQLGGARPGTRLEDLPSDLRIREFPAASKVAA